MNLTKRELKQPELTDPADVRELNDNCDTLEEHLNAITGYDYGKTIILDTDTVEVGKIHLNKIPADPDFGKYFLIISGTIWSSSVKEERSFKDTEEKLEEKYNKDDWSKVETTTTGNQEMPNGIIMKWGNIVTSGSPGFGKGTVTFDIPFPNNLFNVQLTNIGTSTEFFASKMDNSTLSTNGFECWVEGGESAYRYLAIGN